jgi:hypothetical protein
MNRRQAEPIAKMVSLSRGLYARVARRMRCDVSYVSRIARGERRSARVEAVLRTEFRNVLKKLKLNLGQHGRENGET